MKTNYIISIIRYWKYLFAFALVYLTTCGYDGCYGGGAVEPPPDPVIYLSYTMQTNEIAKIYFTPAGEKLIVNSISVSEPISGVYDELIYGYPYVLANPGTAHYINQYDIKDKGTKWSVTISGVSKTTGNSFSVTKELEIGG
jgi:hypothetical protein